MTDPRHPGSRLTVDFRNESRTPQAADSPMQENADIAEDPRVVEVVHEYLKCLEEGERPDRAAYIQRYPELAEIVEQCLDGVEMVQAGFDEQRVSPAAGGMPAMPPGQSEMLPESLGDFRIVREIARGGMGVVYEAVQLSLARKVALKVLPFAATLDPRQLQRFKTEAQAAALLHHTNIVPVYAVGCERGVHFYAMQLIEGQSLALLIAQLRQQAGLASADDGRSQESVRSSQVLEGDAAINSSAASRQGRRPQPVLPLPETTSKFHAALSTQHVGRDSRFFKTAAQLMLQAARALEHAHEFGIIHRDIKPANLLLDAQGVLWVADFGLAQFHTEAGLTRTGDILGTLRYMSPEQAAGHKAILDRRTDVYSLGATFYELLTLNPIFRGSDVQLLLHQVLHADPRPLRQLDKAVPVELETIILKSVSKNPDERYRTAGELAADLERYLNHQPILARRPSLVDRLRKWSRRHPSVVISGMLLLAVLATGMFIINYRETQRAQEESRREAQRANAENQRETQRADEAEKRVQQTRRVVDALIEFGDEELAGNWADGSRQRLLGIALDYYQDSVDQRGGDADSQAHLQRVQNRVNTILHEMAVLQRAMVHGVLEKSAVRQALALTESQQKQLSELQSQWQKESDQYQADWWSLGDEDRRRRMVELAEKHDQALDGLLSVTQRQRLTEIAIQFAGIFAFKSPEIIKKLELTSAQRKSIREIEREILRPPFEPGFESHAPGRGNSGKRSGPPRMSKRESVAKVLEILTPEQVETWNKLTGAPFAEIDEPFGRGGPPSFGGGPPNERRGGRGGPRGSGPGDDREGRPRGQ